MPELKLADKDDADVDYRLLDELRTSPTLTFTPHAEAAAPADTKLVSRARAVMISVGRSYDRDQSAKRIDVEAIPLTQFALEIDEQTARLLEHMPAGSAGKRGVFDSAMLGALDKLARFNVTTIGSWVCRDDGGMVTAVQWTDPDAPGCDITQLGGGIDKSGAPCMTHACHAAVVAMLSPEFDLAKAAHLQTPDGGAAIKADAQSGGLLGGGYFINGNAINTYAGQTQLTQEDSRLSYRPSGKAAQRVAEAEGTIARVFKLFAKLRQPELVVLGGIEAGTALAGAAAAVQATITKLKASDYEAMGVTPRTLDFSRCNDDDDDTGVYGIFLVELSTGLDVVVAVVQVCLASLPHIISRACPCMMRSCSLPCWCAGTVALRDVRLRFRRQLWLSTCVY
jgi:hypothetical protein